MPVANNSYVMHCRLSRCHRRFLLVTLTFLAGIAVRAEVPPVVPIKVVPFALEDVRLLPGGPFYHAMELDRQYLKR